ncbi:MAG: PepSY domain-containing protein [Burkholderiales bacterium]|nr:PepSY domain-containing protein [Burkholderiales bacterium]
MSAAALRKSIGAVMLAIAVALPVQAGDARDHERARHALEAGEIMPLKAILERVERDTPGQVIEVELEREAGRWIYEIKLLARGGSIVKLEIDARDGNVLRRKGGRKTERGTER